MWNVRFSDRVDCPGLNVLCLCVFDCQHLAGWPTRHMRSVSNRIGTPSLPQRYYMAAGHRVHFEHGYLSFARVMGCAPSPP